MTRTLGPDGTPLCSRTTEMFKLNLLVEMLNARGWALLRQHDRGISSHSVGAGFSSLRAQDAQSAILNLEQSDTVTRSIGKTKSSVRCERGSAPGREGVVF
jgi:hypothetical protein